MRNVIQFRNGFVFIPKTKVTRKNLNYALSIVGDIMQFGYILDRDAINHLAEVDVEDLVQFHNEIITFLKVSTGSTHSFIPFWKNFPNDVMSLSETELWLHQILHYLSNGYYEPNHFTITKKRAFEQPNYTIITLGDESRFQKIFTDLVSVNSSLTPEDLNTIKFFVSSNSTLVFPESIPFKENLCTLAAMGLDVPVKTVTDVLRIAVHMSGGDISLPALPRKFKKSSWGRKVLNEQRDDFKFKKFKRKERVYLLSLLEKTNCDVREMVLKDSRWIRLGEILHPGEYSLKFPKAYEMFFNIRNTKVISWYGEVDHAFKQRFDIGVKKLSERPGEFMRKLDWLLRNANRSNVNLVLDVMRSIGSKVSNKVLYETLEHFKKRVKAENKRSITIKGARRKVNLPVLPALDEFIVENVKLAIYSILFDKFSKLEKLGKVWIDSDLLKIPLPTNMRSLNTALKPTIRGQRVPIKVEKSKVIRAYVHWFDEHGNRDIDLTATFVGNDIKVIGWNGAHNDTIGCYSGDIRHRRGACAEYIDINIAKSLEKEYKYVIIDARNYDGGGFEQIKDCVFGYMERSRPEAYSTFVPATIANAVRLQSHEDSIIVAVIDLENMEYIFLDIDQKGIPVASVHHSEMLEIIKEYISLPTFSVYHLLKIHVDARGEQVSERSDADNTFDFETFSESYIEILKYMGV